MIPILITLAALVALSLLRPLLVLGLAHLFARAIGESALSRQPDAIHLDRAAAEPWHDPGPAREATRALRAAGFEEAGTWTVRELPGTLVALLAHASEGFYAAIYEHPRVGHWVDLFTYFADGTSATFTSNAPSGLDPRPGHRLENLPGAPAAALLERARGARPRLAPAPHAPGRAVSDFTRAWADAVRWRKAHGVSAHEVAAVARRAA
jgi:hypothetical protein